MRKIAVCVAAALLFARAPLTYAGAQSGYAYLTPEMQQLQDDEFGNPGLLAVDQGRSLFTTPGVQGKSCAGCHGEDAAGLAPEKIAHYPIFDEKTTRPLTLRAQILRCWKGQLGNAPLPYGDRRALQLEAFVRHRARGATVDVQINDAMRPYYQAGDKLFHTRWGQVDIACHQCHDYHAGQTFRGQMLTQGQTNGFPVYRFTTGQTVGLPERITECLTSLRAEPFPADSPEYRDLEVYMSARSNGLKIETPGIRY